MNVAKDGRSSYLRLWIFIFFFLLGTAFFETAQSRELQSGEAAQDDPKLRKKAEQRVSWSGEANAGSRGRSTPVKIKILAINDFHGQIGTGKKVAGRPVGSAPVLTSYLKEAMEQHEGETIIVHVGDHVGASPPASALLQDEPSIQFLNLLANKHCSYKNRFHPQCNLVATVGNHEFDDGIEEMDRLIFGGNHAEGPFLEDPYRCARFPYVVTNVVDAETGYAILPPFVIKRINGVGVAFIGAVIKETPTMVTPSGVAGLEFLDEADAVNAYIPYLQSIGIRSVVAVIHLGGYQGSYLGSTDPDSGEPDGPIMDVVKRLDDEVDVVISGHAHGFTNAIVENNNGKDILVTQSWSSGTAYADIELEIDRSTKDVVAKSAAIITTWADQGPGLFADAEVSALLQDAEDAVAFLVEQIVGEASDDILRAQNDAGESALGNLIADVQREEMGTDFAFMNPGGIRADIYAGEVTWGDLYTVQPFNNYLVKMDLTGEQIYRLLNQQWKDQPYPRILQISGLSYNWDASRPEDDRIIEIRRNGKPIDLSAVYTLTVNSFLADGGDNFTVLKEGTNRIVGPVDLDALLAFIESLGQPVSASIEGRIFRLN
jgi:5'-nucleotidase